MTPITDPAVHRCAAGGFIVGAKQRVPDDPRYFQTSGAEFLVGCNQLRCTLCGGAVRQQAGFRDGEAASTHAKTIYDAADWTKSPHVAPDANSRLYACGCTIMVVSGAQAAQVPNHVWTCAGHPAAGDGTTLPPITQQAANGLVLLLANMQLTQSIRQIALTRTDGTGFRAIPAFLSLGGDWPTLRIWTEQDQASPTDVDWAGVAGGCVQSTAGELQSF